MKLNAIVISAVASTALASPVDKRQGGGGDGKYGPGVWLHPSMPTRYLFKTDTKRRNIKPKAASSSTPSITHQTRGMLAFLFSSGETAAAVRMAYPTFNCSNRSPPTVT